MAYTKLAYCFLFSVIWRFAGSSYCPYHLPGVDSSKLHQAAHWVCLPSLHRQTADTHQQLAECSAPNYAIKTMQSIMSCSILGECDESLYARRPDPRLPRAGDVTHPVLRLIRGRACQTMQLLGDAIAVYIVSRSQTLYLKKQRGKGLVKLPWQIGSDLTGFLRC